MTVLVAKNRMRALCVRMGGRAPTELAEMATTTTAAIPGSWRMGIMPVSSDEQILLPYTGQKPSVEYERPKSEQETGMDQCIK